MYHNGVGVAQSDTEAVKWYRNPAEQGLCFSGDAGETALRSIQFGLAHLRRRGYLG